MGQMDYAALAKQFGGTSEGAAWTPGGEMIPGLRPAVTDEAGNPPGVGDSLSRLLTLLEPMAHPRTLDDIGHLLMQPVDATRGTVVPSIIKALRARLPSRQTAGSAVERLGQELQHPVQVPGRMVEGAGKLLKGPEPPAPAPPAPTPRPGSFEDFFTADPTRRTQIMDAREAYRLKPRSLRTTGGASPAGTPVAAPPAAGTPVTPSAPAGLADLTDAEAQAVAVLRQEGYSEADLQAALAHYRATASTPLPLSASANPIPTATTASPGSQDLAEVQRAYDRLIAAGKSQPEALDLIQQQLTMRERLGLPSGQQIWNDFAYRQTHGGRPQR